VHLAADALIAAFVAVCPVWGSGESSEGVIIAPGFRKKGPMPATICLGGSSYLLVWLDA
jgi:hypothetical protein